MDYVQGGGKLIMEATSGLFEPGMNTSNLLGSLLGVPEALPVQSVAGKVSENVQISTDSMLAGTEVAFRISNWNPPINTQTVPWIHNIPRAYLRPYRLPHGNGEGAIGALDDNPAVLLRSLGKGQVLFFAGVIDWLECPGLARRLDDWGRGRPFNATIPEDPAVLCNTFRKGDIMYVLGRRFASHDVLASLKKGQRQAIMDDVQTLMIPAAGLDGRGKVRELLSGKDLGEVNLSDLKLTLKPGEAFLLEISR